MRGERRDIRVPKSVLKCAHFSITIKRAVKVPYFSKTIFFRL